MSDNLMCFAGTLMHVLACVQGLPPDEPGFLGVVASGPVSTTNDIPTCPPKTTVAWVAVCKSKIDRTVTCSISAPTSIRQWAARADGNCYEEDAPKP